MERERNPNIKKVSQIIQECKGNIFQVAQRLGCEIDNLKIFGALWPNDSLRTYFENKKKLSIAILKAKYAEQNQEAERKKTDARYKREQKYLKIKETIEKYGGDRDKAAEELGISYHSMKKACARIYYSFDDFQYFKPRKKRDEEYSIWPTNEERLYYKDNPHIKYIKDGLKNKCLEKKKTES